MSLSSPALRDTALDVAAAWLEASLESLVGDDDRRQQYQQFAPLPLSSTDLHRIDQVIQRMVRDMATHRHTITTTIGVSW